jgi:RNA polymerase-associated protein LEO1
MNLDDEQNDLFGSDSEDDEVNDNKSKNTTMNDIFGESDSNNEEEALESQNNTTTVSNEDGPSMRDIFGDMDDDNDNTFPDKKNGELDDIFGSNNKDEENNLPIQSYIFIPKIPKFNEDDSHIILRMPNFMKIKANPYDPKTYNPQRELESCGHASCVVRWRYVLDNDGMQILDENGRPKMESNAKLVKFSDGTYQVIVGQDVYDASLTRHNDRYVNNKIICIYFTDY